MGCLCIAYRYGHEEVLGLHHALALEVELEDAHGPLLALRLHLRAAERTERANVIQTGTPNLQMEARTGTDPPHHSRSWS